jgi:cytochrome c-type biogenesis protein
VLLAWIAQAGSPLAGMVLLTAFAAGQVLPLMLAGVAAAWLPRLLALRAVGQWVPVVSGVVLLLSGTLTLLARLV